jgi:hypothetical protein
LNGDEKKLARRFVRIGVAQVVKKAWRIRLKMFCWVEMRDETQLSTVDTILTWGGR